MGALSLTDGTPTGGVYGFAAIAMEIVKKIDPTKVIVAWDSKSSTSKRRAMFPEYKAGRIKPGEDFYTQIPLLKIGEMYLIAAEASGDISYLNTMRKNRGYVNDESSDHFNELLIGEYQRELFAEGQLFYFYKRLNMESIPNALVFAPENYILPVPDDEKEFGYSE